MARNLLYRRLVRHELAAFRRIDTIEARVGNRRRSDAHMNLGSTAHAHHLHDFARGGASHDGVIHQHHSLALEHRAIGIVLQPDTQVADFLPRLDEGPAHIVIANDAEVEGEPGFLREAKRCWNPRIGYRDDEVGGRRILSGQFPTDGLTRLIDGGASYDRIRTGEVDEFEYAKARRLCGHQPD